MHRKRRYTNEQLADAVNQSQSAAEVLRKLGLRAAGGNYALVHARIRELGLDISHFTHQRWAGRRKPTGNKQSLETILIENSTYQNSHKLRKRLIAEGIFEARCTNCGLTEWLEHPIPLEIHHVNGDRWDHSLDNLRLLCPNCHALTATYRGKNKNGQRS